MRQLQKHWFVAVVGEVAAVEVVAVAAVVVVAVVVRLVAMLWCYHWKEKYSFKVMNVKSRIKTDVSRKEFIQTKHILSYIWPS